MRHGPSRDATRNTAGYSIYTYSTSPASHYKNQKDIRGCSEEHILENLFFKFDFKHCASRPQKVILVMLLNTEYHLPWEVLEGKKEVQIKKYLLNYKGLSLVKSEQECFSVCEWSITWSCRAGSMMFKLMKM